MTTNNRLRELAWRESLRRHNKHADVDGYGRSDGHEDRHGHCPHPDCVLVREAPARVPADPPQRKASDVLGDMDSVGPLTHAPGKPAAQPRGAEPDLPLQAASLFIRDVIEALGESQPPLDACVDLPALALRVVGQIEDYKVRAEQTEAALALAQRERDRLQAQITNGGCVDHRDYLDACEERDQFQRTVVQLQQEIEELRTQHAREVVSYRERLRPNDP